MQAQKKAQKSARKTGDVGMSDAYSFASDFKPSKPSTAAW